MTKAHKVPVSTSSQGTGRACQAATLRLGTPSLAPGLKEALRDLRHGGLRLAIDDAGAGYSSLNHIVELVPEFIKLDLFLTRGIDGDAVKRALAAALVSFANDVGAELIAEGVETEAELTALEDLGIQHAQGFYLGRPLPLPFDG